MPITKSAKKAQRQSKKKRLMNLTHLNRIKLSIGQFKKLLSEQKVEEAKALLPKIYKQLDKAAKRNTMHSNKAARKKSRITLMLNKTEVKK
jgi:small subunit ribosomal protein S20